MGILASAFSGLVPERMRKEPIMSKSLTTNHHTRYLPVSDSEAREAQQLFGNQVSHPQRCRAAHCVPATAPPPFPPISSLSLSLRYVPVLATHHRCPPLILGAGFALLPYLPSCNGNCKRGARDTIRTALGARMRQSHGWCSVGDPGE